ncbi:MAG: prepilin-type N-terminal cleavage/methylation domain-containing protein [bacterium]|nr:prepilin-type N-terminal cleavage/methylation domain-containing protein [bacterium]
MNKKGFTLIELLVVIAIIGLLSTLAVVALSSAREKARDSKRLSDLKQIQTALELYYTDNSAYPVSAGLQLGGADTSDCLDDTTAGFSGACAAAPTATYMGLVPSDPLNTDTNVYTYTSVEFSNAYTITAVLEGEVGTLSDAITASQSGIIKTP